MENYPTGEIKKNVLRTVHVPVCICILYCCIQPQKKLLSVEITGTSCIQKNVCSVTSVKKFYLYQRYCHKLNPIQKTKDKDNINSKDE